MLSRSLPKLLDQQPARVTNLPEGERHSLTQPPLVAGI